jgi:hypothetical protein
MSSRRLLVAAATVPAAVSLFLLGAAAERRGHEADRAAYDAKLDAIRSEVRLEIEKNRTSDVTPMATEATSGSIASTATPKRAVSDDGGRTAIVNEVKAELQHEMGLMPLQLLRDRRSSFVELYTTDSLGRTNYGTAGYLGHGYFITVKHAVVALKDDDAQASSRKIVSINVMDHGSEVPARVVDTGDADVEVHPGDWAIIKTKELDLPALRPDVSFAFDFADAIFRLGNDYSKGIVVSSGYVGQRTSNGLVTALTDGHPGVSGGGVIDQHGDLVGIPIGRMQGDYRFSFILPLRAEMLRKVPHIEKPQPIGTFADAH